MQTGAGQDGGSGAAALYRGLRTRRSGGVLGDINVTPLVDVVLVLLLVFMVTAPMMSRGIDVSLPVANQPQIDPKERVSVSVNEEGRVYVGEQPVALPLLAEVIKGLMEGRQQKVAYLRADERLRYGKVIEVVDILKRAGVEQIGFVYVLPQEKAKAGQ